MRCNVLGHVVKKDGCTDPAGGRKNAVVSMKAAQVHVINSNSTHGQHPRGRFDASVRKCLHKCRSKYLGIENIDCWCDQVHQSLLFGVSDASASFSRMSPYARQSTAT